MKRETNNENIRLVVVITVCVLLIVSVVMLGVYNYKPRSTIVIGGMGEVEVVPDLIDINFEVRTNAKTLSEAKQKNDDLTSSVTEALILQGINESEIQTKNLYVNEEYDWSSSTRKSLGFVASHYLIVRIPTEDAKRISNVVNSGIDAGSTLNYIGYSLSEELEDKMKSEAVLKATMDAKKKAEAMAKNLGLRLGRIVQVSESYSNSGIYYAKALSVDSFDRVEGGSIQPETQTQTASLSIVFEVR